MHVEKINLIGGRGVILNLSWGRGGTGIIRFGWGDIIQLGGEG